MGASNNWGTFWREHGTDLPSPVSKVIRFDVWLGVVEPEEDRIDDPETPDARTTLRSYAEKR